MKRERYIQPEIMVVSATTSSLLAAVSSDDLLRFGDTTGKKSYPDGNYEDDDLYAKEQWITLRDIWEDE